MDLKLMAARYDDVAMSTTIAAPDENFDDIMDLGVRIAFPGGLQRLELTIKAKSRADAYSRYTEHLGQRIIVYDTFTDKFLNGQIYEVAPDGRFVTYICAGSWKRLSMERWLFSSRPAYGASINTEDIIINLLNDTATSFSNSSQSNISGTSVNAGGWVNQTEGGSSTGISGTQAVTELIAIGDSSDNPVHFYFVDGSFSGPLVLELPKPYLISVSSTAAPDWQVEMENIAPGGLSVSRNIWNLKTSIRVSYGRYFGSATSTGTTDGVLTASAATFETNQIGPGDAVYNLTTRLRYTVKSVDSQTQLTVTEDTTTAFTSGDEFAVRLSNQLHTAAASGTTNYWSVSQLEDFPYLDQTQALQIRDKLVALYDEPVQQQAFVLSSKYIKDGNGAKQPLWRPLFGDSFYFRIIDLFPEDSLFGESDNRRSSFWSVALDYTYRNNRLRIVPSTLDSRLDAVLARAGIISGQTINTESVLDRRTEVFDPRFRMTRQETRAEQERLIRERGQAHEQRNRELLEQSGALEQGERLGRERDEEQKRRDRELLEESGSEIFVPSREPSNAARDRRRRIAARRKRQRDREIEEARRAQEDE